MLERIANPDGNSDVIGIIKDFYDEIGLASASVSNYAASKIAGNSYSSFSALKTAIEGIKESGAKEQRYPNKNRRKNYKKDYEDRGKRKEQAGNHDGQ